MGWSGAACCASTGASEGSAVLNIVLSPNCMEDIFTTSVVISPPRVRPGSTSASSGVAGPTGSVSAAQLRDASLVRGVCRNASNKDTTQLLQRRDAGGDLRQPVVPQGPHAQPHRLALEILAARPPDGE